MDFLFLQLDRKHSGSSESGSFESHEYKPEGLCIDGMSIHAICIAGSNLEGKMAEVMATCMNPTQAAGRGTGKGKGKGKGKGSKEKNPSCPTFGEITEKLEDKFGYIGCMLQTLGWVDENYEQVNETINEDIASLTLSADLSEESIQDCIADEFDDIRQSREAKLVESCIENYSEEEMALLSNIVSGIAGFKCFTQAFDETCRSWVDFNFVQPLIQTLLMGPGKQN